MIIEKDIHKLAVGSYVTGIDKQKGKYNIKSSGWVRDAKSIEFLIQQGVLRVTVDTSKSLGEISQKNEVSVAAEKSKKNRTRSRSAISKKAELQEQFSAAKKLFQEAKALQSKVLSDIQKDHSIDTKPIVALTNQSIEMIFDNPDALACVLNIRCKDDYLLEHSISLSILISIFACYLGFDKQLTHELAIGAFLHDVGKIKVPNTILNKPGKLTEEEFEVMKSHVVHSIKIVDETEELSDISRSIVAKHHEKLNGVGYPRGLKANSLSRYDKMITICDIFDALSATRVYKQGITQIRAFSILRELVDLNQLDNDLVNQFIKCLGVYPIGSLVKLTSNRLAIVTGHNSATPTKPKVKSFYSLSQKVFTEAKEIDLAVNTNEAIEQAVRADEYDLDMNKITEFLFMHG